MTCQGGWGDPDEPTRRTLTRTDRAQAYLLLVAAGTLILVAMIIAVFEPVVSDVKNQSTSVSQTQASADGIEYVHDFWTWIPLTVLLLLLVMLIAGSIFQSRRP